MKISKYSNLIILRRIIVLFIIFSIFITFLNASFTTIITYNRYLKEIYRDINNIESTQLEILKNSAFNFDYDAILIQLESLIQNSHFVYLEFINENGEKIFAGNKSSTMKNIIPREYLLEDRVKNKNIFLGTFTIHATTYYLWEQIFHQLPLILLYQTIQIIFISVFLLVTIYFFLLRHFNQIIKFTDSLNLKNLNDLLILKNKPDNKKKPDEIDRLVNAINRMIERIKNEVEQKEKMNLSLQASESRFKNLVENAPVAIVLLEVSGKIMNVNSKACQFLKYAKDELLKKTVMDIDSYHPDLDKLNEVWNQLNGNNVVTIEGKLIRSDNSMFDAEISLCSIYFDDKKYILAFVRDISAIKKSEERLKLAILGTRAGLWDWDIQTGEFFVNERWAEIFGYSLEEISPVNIEKLNELYHPDDFKKSDKLLQLHFSGKLGHYECEIRIKQKNGKWAWILSRGKIADRDAEGEAIRMTGTIQDITHQKDIENEIRILNIQLEDRVKERTFQLEQSNAELESFAYTVSHDLRAPLRSINGFSRVLMEDYYDKIDEKLRDYLERISAGSQKMGQLIDDILELSKATRREIKWEQVNLSKVAKKVASELKENNPDRAVEFDITDDIIVKGDLFLLTTVFENLIGNAWKFTKQEEKTKISFGVRNKKKERQYYIRDNGIGFEMKYIGNLFKPFKRLHSEKDYPGSGIGLANVQRVISKHGGKIWAESGGKRKGATFYFTLQDRALGN